MLPSTRAVTTMAVDEPLGGAGKGALSGHGVWRTSAPGQAGTRARGATRRSHAKVAIPHFNLFVVHLGTPHVPQAVRVFKDFAAQEVPELFPNCPSKSEQARWDCCRMTGNPECMVCRLVASENEMILW